MNEDWLDSFKIDGEAGPASPLAARDANALAAKAVDRALPVPPSGGGGNTQTWMHAAIIGVSAAILSVGAYTYSRSEAPAPVASSIAVPAITATAAAPVLPEPATTTTPIESVAVDSLPNAAPPPQTVVAAAKPSAAVIEPKTASDLLAEANHARRQSQWAEAAALYERVMHSQADESYAATVALASLRLEHFGDPSGALALYERALSDRPGGALTAQAEAGAARCRSALDSAR